MIESVQSYVQKHVFFACFRKLPLEEQGVYYTLRNYLLEGITMPTPIITMRLDSDLQDAITVYIANNQGSKEELSRSSIIRDALISYLAFEVGNDE